jgi:hypothetical protein
MLHEDYLRFMPCVSVGSLVNYVLRDLSYLELWRRSMLIYKVALMHIKQHYKSINSEFPCLYLLFVQFYFHVSFNVSSKI